MIAAKLVGPKDLRLTRRRTGEDERQKKDRGDTKALHIIRSSARDGLALYAIADMGGWSCVETLVIYQRLDAETRQLVLTDR